MTIEDAGEIVVAELTAHVLTRQNPGGVRGGDGLYHPNCYSPNEPGLTVHGERARIEIREDDPDESCYAVFGAGDHWWSLPREGRPRCRNCLKLITPDGYTVAGWRDILAFLSGAE